MNRAYYICHTNNINRFLRIWKNIGLIKRKRNKLFAVHAIKSQ